MVGTLLNRIHLLLATCFIVLLIASVAAADWDACCGCDVIVVTDEYEEMVINMPVVIEDIGPHFVMAEDDITVGRVSYNECDEYGNEYDEYGDRIISGFALVMTENGCMAPEASWTSAADEAPIEAPRPATDPGVDDSLEDVELQRSPNIDEDEQLDDWDTA